MKKSFKRAGYMLLSMFILGISGLFLSLGQLNATYENHKQSIADLSERVETLKKIIDTNKEKIARYDFMNFKNTAFSVRFPEFSGIIETVYQKSIIYGFKPEVILGIMKVESNFNPRAVSYRGAYGLMQVNLSVWQKELKIDPNRIFDVAYNIDTGLKILKNYLDLTHGNLKRAIHLYNNGFLYNNTNFAVRVNSATLSFSPTPVVESPENIGAISY